MKKLLLLSVLLSGPFIATEAFTQDKAKAEPSATASEPGDTDRVNVDAIKEKYWARGEKEEMGVVQNRMYTKSKRFDLGVFGGLISTDPFLSVKSTGLSFGYHFNEYFALNALGMKYFVSPSNALQTFETTRNATTNTNEPRYFYGLEGVASVLYGKLSLAGLKIIHYDLHFLGGAGLTNTESGNWFTPIAGIGQQFYMNNSVSLRFDYRFMPYREEIREKVIPTKIGQVVDERWNLTHSITLGITYLFGGGSK